MSLFRQRVEKIAGYVPGEQPQDTGWIKLNTNENPYPPSPAVADAIRSAATDRLNLYPDPMVLDFRHAAAELFGVDADWILPANGSDENLTILFRSFTDAGERVAFPYPSYVLYETLADLQGCNHDRLVLNPDWSWNHERCANIVSNSKMVLIPNPNSPSGNRWSDQDLLSLQPPNGVLVVDEAYGDFADSPHEAQLLHGETGDRMVITRTLSKSYSLAGIRFGFAIARPDLIFGMRKVKDSYNCDRLAIAAATAAIKDQDWMLSNRAKIIATRTRLAAGMSELGFECVPSEANFVWAIHPSGDHERIFLNLKEHKILIRYMQFPGSELQLPYDAPKPDGLRVTVGTDDEVDSFLQVLRQVV